MDKVRLRGQFFFSPQTSNGPTLTVLQKNYMNKIKKRKNRAGTECRIESAELRKTRVPKIMIPHINLKILAKGSQNDQLGRRTPPQVREGDLPEVLEGDPH